MMNRPRYSPRLTGAGRGIVKQALEKGLVKMWFPPRLRAQICEETGCTDADIDKAFSGALETFDKEFNALLAKQRAEMVPPPEDDEDLPEDDEDWYKDSTHSEDNDESETT